MGWSSGGAGLSAMISQLDELEYAKRVGLWWRERYDRRRRWLWLSFACYLADEVLLGYWIFGGAFWWPLVVFYCLLIVVPVYMCLSDVAAGDFFGPRGFHADQLRNVGGGRLAGYTAAYRRLWSAHVGDRWLAAYSEVVQWLSRLRR